METVKATSRELANAIRFLAIDAVNQAKSGHPGAPMGMADIAEVLWRRYLKHNPANPTWPNRDRFVLSNGHGSMLLYALLHLSGYPLTIDDLKNFRQLHSKTPGHPEVDITPGVETTTGPLGQGLANAVGMALAEKILAQRFNRQGHQVIDHRTWVFLGDGCLMEGVSHEACSLAGVWGLDKLVCFYDDNGISIDGHVEGWFRDDTAARFKAYGWNVIGPIDGHDAAAIAKATEQAIEPSGKPTMIICRTTIGWGAPNMAGTHDVHGAPLGDKETAATRAALGWSHPPFEIPKDISHAWNGTPAGIAREAEWQAHFDAYAHAYPDLAAEFKRATHGSLPANWADIKASMFELATSIAAATATRKSSQQMLDLLVAGIPELLGGSADLTGSNLTAGKTSRAWHSAKQGGDVNYLSYGVREFGMAAIMNGAALHGGLIPYGGTFAVFSDYARNAIRMSALMKQRVIHVLTHDSIGLGEDGPTHQPIEHAATLRLIPDLHVWRPCDGMETAVAWSTAVERQHGPSALLLSRQNLPQLSAGVASALIAKGGYVLSDCTGKPEAVLIATGSEVSLAIEAQQQLLQQNRHVRVVSMPCTALFDAQTADYQQQVLPEGVKRIAIEAGHPDFWRKYVGLTGNVIGIARFGESAPAAQVYELLGMTTAKLVAAV